MRGEPASEGAQLVGQPMETQPPVRIKPAMAAMKRRILIFTSAVFRGAQREAR